MNGAWGAIALILATSGDSVSRIEAAWVSGLEKIRPSKPPKGRRTSSTVRLARGECEGLQLWVAPGASGVRLDAPPLKGPTGTLAVKLYREAFVEIRTPSHPDSSAGLWPDPLIPMDVPLGPGVSASTHARPLVYYFELCAPLGAAPGAYRGQVTLSADGRSPLALALIAHVEPIRIPATSTFPNSFGLSIYSLARGHHLNADSETARQLLASYARSALAHRISLHGMSMRPPPARVREGRLEIDFDDYDHEIGPFLDGSALGTGATFTALEVRKPLGLARTEEIDYLRAFRRHLEGRGWRGQLFYYAKDEPKAPEYPLVLEQADRARAADGLPVLVTSPFVDPLAPSTDIFCPNLNCFFPRAGPQTCPKVLSAPDLRKRIGRDKKVWWYQSCSSHGCAESLGANPRITAAYSSWASYVIDRPATSNRAMGPLAYLNGIDGELYFDTVYAFNSTDPWTNTFAFGGNGDGTLFYPGRPDVLGAVLHVPVESLRLKHLRDGLEDYELLRLAGQRVSGAFARQQARTLVRSGYEINEEVAVWEAVHLNLLLALRTSSRATEYGSPGAVAP